MRRVVSPVIPSVRFWPVQEVNAGKTFQQAQIASVVMNSTYTKSARQLAQAMGVLLLHHDDLPQLSTHIQAFTTV